MLLLAIVSSALALVNPTQVLAQADFANQPETQNFGGTLFSGEELFANDGRTRLLVLALSPYGLTESATEQIGLILEKNLSNTGHFDVVGAREMNAAFERTQPDLLDCREIACGVESGKLLGAQRVVIGSLRMDEPYFRLSIRIIDPANNLTDFSDEIRFTDDNMENALFHLANTISENSLRVGRVLSTSIRGIVISLGRVHGIELGDHLVIYKQEVPITDLQGRQLDVQRKNVAIVKVLNVNENTAEAILAHKTEDPQVAQYVQTYLDPQRQIAMIENTRKELDTGIRLANKIRPLELAPVLLADSERKTWQRRLAAARTDKDLWITVMGVGGGLTVLVLNSFTSDTTGLIKLGAAGAVAGFGFWEWNDARSRENDLLTEGRSKGYVSFRVQPWLNPQGGIGLQLAGRF